MALVLASWSLSFITWRMAMRQLVATAVKPV